MFFFFKQKLMWKALRTSHFPRTSNEGDNRDGGPFSSTLMIEIFAVFFLYYIYLPFFVIHFVHLRVHSVHMNNLLHKIRVIWVVLSLDTLFTRHQFTARDFLLHIKYRILLCTGMGSILGWMGTLWSKSLLKGQHSLWDCRWTAAIFN